MDLISHSLLGAVAGFSALSAKLGRKALLLGAAGGIVPDIDFLLRPLANPALPGELHRHFTHSLVFVPVGGLIALMPFLFSKTVRSQWKLAWAATTLGSLSHGLLDTATSFGTRWFWPFSDARPAWDMIAVIDPVFTLVLLIGVVVAAIVASRKPAVIALVFALLYLGLGEVQNQRGLEAQRQLAASRGHTNVRGRVMPTLANLVVWRSVYEHEGRIYCDAIRLPIADAATVREGESLATFTTHDLAPGMPEHVTDVVDRFSTFADSYVAAISDTPLIVGDLRYAVTAESTQPLWGLTLAEGNPHPEHTTAHWTTFFDARRETVDKLWASIWSDEGFLPVEATSPGDRSASPAPVTARD